MAAVATHEAPRVTFEASDMFWGKKTTNHSK